MPRVRCTVSNCTHWAEGWECTADTILIDIDLHAGDFMQETGILDNALHKDYSPDQKTTMCHTFRPKGE